MTRDERYEKAVDAIRKMYSIIQDTPENNEEDNMEAERLDKCIDKLDSICDTFFLETKLSYKKGDEFDE